MNILFFADPNSIHDEKWISYFSEKKLYYTYILPRVGQVNDTEVKTLKPNLTLLEPIPDFSILRFYQTLFTAIKIKAFIKRHRIDLIHILYAEPNSLWALFRFFFKVPIIISSRGTDVLQAIPKTFRQRSLINRIVAPAYRKAFLNADWITCTSDKQGQVISGFSGRSDRMSIVRTGVNIDCLKIYAELPPPLNESDRYIFFPRYIRPIYNHEFCLEAIELLPSNLKEYYRMVFVGRNSGDPTYQQFLEEKMKALKNVDIIFLEKQNQKNLIQLYKRVRARRGRTRPCGESRRAPPPRASAASQAAS